MATPAEHLHGSPDFVSGEQARESVPYLRSVPDEELELPVKERDPIRIDADATQVIKLENPDNEGNTHVFRRDGNLIGAAEVSVESKNIDPDLQIQTARIHFLGTDPSNYKSVYLALLENVIKSDHLINQVEGTEGTAMTLAAADLSLGGYLPPGWSCEYTLIGQFSSFNKGYSDDEATTFDPRYMLAHVNRGQPVEHSFKRTYEL
ncbi:MAG TPA: hypothetical protein VEH48_00275 [Candidatus Nitrosopolaris sp.]|nr:hypothetical protein [Candidatus Nitrosopolaris sp.]